MKMANVFQTGRNHCGKRRNCSSRAISPFPIVVSKDFYDRHVKTRACIGNGSGKIEEKNGRKKESKTKKKNTNKQTNKQMSEKKPHGIERRKQTTTEKEKKKKKRKQTNKSKNHEKERK